MPILPRLERSVERLAASPRFSEMLGEPLVPAWSQLTQAARGPLNFSQLTGAGGVPAWSAFVGQPGGSLGGALYQRRPHSLGWLDQLDAALFETAEAKRQREAAPGQNTGPGSSPLPGPAPSPAGGAGDTWDGAAIGEWIRTQRPNSPVIPIAGEIAAYAQSRGVDPSLIFGQLQAESGFASDTGLGTRKNNPGNIMAPGANPAAGVIILREYPTMLDGIKAMVDTVASYNGTYGQRFAGPQGGKLTLEQMVAIYYVGPEAYARYGLEANDAGGSGPGGNGTVNDYLRRHVYPVQQALAPFRRAPAGGTGPVAYAPYTGGAAGMESIWGGTPTKVTQGYGVVSPNVNQGIYDYGRQLGLPAGHTGLDIGLARGTNLYMPAGLTGRVEIAGGTRYFRDEDYGDVSGSPGRGELRIILSNGDILILGHTSAIGVRVGDTVTGGQLLGQSGSAAGDHLHLEVRQRQPDGSYRLVNPAAYFALPGGGQQNY